MAFVGFDLDETLGSFFVLDPFISVFCEMEHLQIGEKDRYTGFKMTKELKVYLKKAYDIFISTIAVKCCMEKKFNLLRPGLLEFFETLQVYRSKDLVKACVIYSNNGNLYLIKAVKNILETIFNDTKIFSGYMHFYHPIRQMANGQFTGQKTFEHFQDILKYSLGCRSTILFKPYNMLFIDDIEHIQIKNKLEPYEGYFKVQPFKSSIKYSDIEPLFLNAITSSKIITLPEFKVYCEKIHGWKVKNELELLDCLRQQYSSYNLMTETRSDPTDMPELLGWFQKQIVRIHELNIQNTILSSPFFPGKVVRMIK